MTTPPVPRRFDYRIRIDYCRKETPERVSGYVRTGKTEAEGCALFDEGLAFYRELGYVIALGILDEVCRRCDGEGRLWVHRGKTTRSRKIGILCPVCDGNPRRTLCTIRDDI
jgi:hypothetical protein